MKLFRIKSCQQYIFTPEGIWDGISDTVLYNHAVSVRNGLIDYVGPAETLDSTLWKDDETVNLPGTILIPGMIDCHIHLAMNCTDLFKAVADWENSPQLSLSQAKSYLEDFLRNGVVAVRD
ncbi:MAG TPA: hypothetical protein VNT57_02980, partial [Desulfobacteria bacterium]|nr:hypothetical protein [Desulfobacteria bacterium]